jgi:DNA invertase Pin-like site-specific DNA recombinase
VKGGLLVVNVERLREEMKNKSVSPDTAAAAMGIGVATYYRRMNRQGTKFTVEEVSKLSALLNLSPDTMQEIFFER